MQWLVDFVNGFATILINILSTVLHWLVVILGTVIGLLFTGLLTIVYTIISALDLGSWALNSASYWGYLDPTICFLLVSTGVPTGMSMLGSAYLIRFVLNLIPAEFTRV